MTYGERLIKSHFEHPDPGLSIHYQNIDPSHFDALICGHVNGFVIWGARNIATDDWLRVTTDAPRGERRMVTFKITRIGGCVGAHRRAGSLDTATVVEVESPF